MFSGEIFKCGTPKGPFRPPANREGTPDVFVTTLRPETHTRAFNNVGVGSQLEFVSSFPLRPRSVRSVGRGVVPCVPPVSRSDGDGFYMQMPSRSLERGSHWPNPQNNKKSGLLFLFYHSKKVRRSLRKVRKSLLRVYSGEGRRTSRVSVRPVFTV